MASEVEGFSESQERGEVSGLDAAQDALNRMRRAHRRGTGCLLTAEMVASLAISMIGEIWAQDDPRASTADLGPACGSVKDE
jgi:hypothetical protein